MSEQASMFGTDPRKLARADGPDTSKEAAGKVDSAKLEHAVYLAIRDFGAAGCTSDEVRSLRQFRDMPYSSVTARYKALMDRELIVDSGRRRKGTSGRSQRVMVAAVYAENKTPDARA